MSEFSDKLLEVYFIFKAISFMVFKNVSNLFSRAVLIISIQEHVHKVWFFLWRKLSARETNGLHTHTKILLGTK